MLGEGEVKITPRVYEKKKEEVAELVGSDVELIKDDVNFKKSVEEFCKNVLIKENIVDSGNFAHVLRGDKDHNLCYKKSKPFAEPANNVHREAALLELVHGISDKVITPYPFLSAEMFRKKKDYIEKTGLIIMEHLNAISLRDIISPLSLDRKKEFPASFMPQKFFDDLVEFLEIMHREKNVYHCDLSNMGNIMVDIETGKPCVIDFGQSSDYPIDENHDYYGRQIIDGIDRVDKDIEAVLGVRGQVYRYLKIDN